MSKPIFIIRYGIQDKKDNILLIKEDLLDYYHKLMNDLSDHHLILVLDPNINDVQFEYFSSKNINEIELDELKKRLLSEIKQRDEEPVEFDIMDKDTLERAKKYFGDLLTPEQEELYGELDKVREEKNRLVKEMEYEKAALYRDKEIKVLNKIEKLNDQKNSTFS